MATVGKKVMDTETEPSATAAKSSTLIQRDGLNAMPAQANSSTSKRMTNHLKVFAKKNSNML